MRLIDADALFKMLKDIYEMIGADPNELHFSLNDMEMNIASMETIVESPIDYLYEIGCLQEYDEKNGGDK